MRKSIVLCIIAVLVAVTHVAHAGTITVTTGELVGSTTDDNPLGINVIYGGSPDNGFFDVTLNLSSPLNTEPANMVVKYGLFSGDHEIIAVYFNGLPLGNMNTSLGYTTPGPQYQTFIITGDLRNGTNSIDFQGDHSQSYVIGQVDINYDPDNQPTPAPEPATILLLGFGLIGFVGMRRNRRQTPEIFSPFAEPYLRPRA